MTTYAMIVDGYGVGSPIVDGYGVGSHVYGEPPATLPAGQIACTQAQAQNPSAWQVVNGSIVAKPPTLAQQAEALIAGGLTISSTSTPALNGTYAVASGVPFGREDIGTEAQFVSTFSEFTNGTTTLQWPLIDGKTFVTFPTTASFMAFAKAAAQFYAACKAVAATGVGTLPPATATIP